MTVKRTLVICRLENAVEIEIQRIPLEPEYKVYIHTIHELGEVTPQ